MNDQTTLELTLDLGLTEEQIERLEAWAESQDKHLDQLVTETLERELRTYEVNIDRYLASDEPAKRKAALHAKWERQADELATKNTMDRLADDRTRYENQKAKDLKLYGQRLTRTNPTTKTQISLYYGPDAGMDTAGGDWQTVCEDHGTVISHQTYKLARGWMTEPWTWCEPCRENPEVK